MTVSTLNRRSFFQKLRSASTGKPEERTGIFGKVKSLLPPLEQELPLVPPPTTTIVLNGGLEPYQGPWDYEQAAHLLRRTGFGVKKADLDLLLTLNVSDAVDHILDVPANPPSPPVNNYFNGDSNNPEGYEDPIVPLGQVWVDADYDGNLEGYRIESFRGWWYGLMLNQEASILERLTLFWHNHFSTQTQAVFYGKTNYQHNAKLRANALGNFKEMTKVVTLEPMMLYYLNGYLNSKDAPDENYARELQELFTVGKDNPDHYTEEDIVAAARVLTGWRINFVQNTTFFYALEHDLEDKQFSSFYNNTVIQGGIDGNAELDALLDMIFAKNEVAEHLCRKLYRWFIYYNIDAAAEQNVILPLAQIFRDNNYDIKPVMETVLNSTHFFDALNKGCFIKTPVDTVIGTLRSFNLSIPGTTPWDDFTMKYYLTYFHSLMQMLPGDPPNVAGWQAFRQSPQYYRIWINGDTARNRNYYTDILSSYYLETNNDQLKIDHIAFVSQFDDPSNPVKLVDDMTKLLLPQPLSAAKKTLLKSILLSGLPSDSYWTIAWFDYINDPTDPMAFEVVNIRLTILTKYILNLPEYQLA
ncbi:MAG: DUF1800 domain-containing protein [Bacteroidetes bacterium]|nr:DUF1800 domain-containing protein [Bacteroidota bacterium]